jgi:hypothetical protein
MAEQQGIKYPVDIVMCIDATGSMGPVIDSVKSIALKFDEDLRAEMDKKGKSIDTLRVKIVVFKDYYADGVNAAMKQSKFFKLPDERATFKDFVEEIIAEGGGDEPENGLEALDLAVRSDWTKESTKFQRHVVVVFTDASAHPLEKSGKPAGYPFGMAKDLNELTDRWEGEEYVGSSAKRLLLFTPDAEPWTTINTA